MGDIYSILAVVSLVIIVVAAVVAAVSVQQANARAAAEPAHELEVGVPKTPSGSNIWVVANPTKPADYEQFVEQVDRKILQATGRRPRWIETSVADPGTGQTIEALRHNPDLVIAAGGDGTVRAVAAGMAHSGVPLGLIPMGTGNLLARNIGLPLEVEEAVDVAIGSVDRSLDIAWLGLDDVVRQGDQPSEGTLLREAHAATVRSLPKWVKEPEDGEFSYLVIAGVGFDGETMAQTDSELKEKVGWGAYVITSLRSLHIPRMKARVTMRLAPEADSEERADKAWRGKLPKNMHEAVVASQTLGDEGGISPAVVREGSVEVTDVTARTVLVANSGELPFATLAPEASLDDGALDVIAIDTRAGLLGWSLLAVKVIGHTAGIRSVNVKNDAASIQFRQVRWVKIEVDRPYFVQVDGDPVGEASKLVCRVEQGALTVRVPRLTPEVEE